jgi:hypothetical protein
MSDAFHLAQLRHAYAQLAAGRVVDQKQFADGLIAPVIRHMEEHIVAALRQARLEGRAEMDAAYDSLMERYQALGTEVLSAVTKARLEAIEECGRIIDFHTFEMSEAIRSLKEKP